MSVIDVRELTKSYDENLVGDDVSFSVDEGAPLGPSPRSFEPALPGT